MMLCWSIPRRNTVIACSPPHATPTSDAANGPGQGAARMQRVSQLMSVSVGARGLGRVSGEAVLLKGVDERQQTPAVAGMCKRLRQTLVA